MKDDDVYPTDDEDLDAEKAPGRYCEMCGAPVSAAARFCGACGKPVATLPAAPAAPPTPPAKAAKAGDPGRERELFVVRPLVLQTFGETGLSLLTLGLFAIVLWVRRLNVRYRITNQRIEYVTGVFSLSRSTVELFRVSDLAVREPPFLRLRGAGHLAVLSEDASEPEIHFRAIPEIEEVREALREAVLEARRVHRVRLLE